MADMGHVDADLMRPAGFELALDSGNVPAIVAIARFHRIMGDRLAAALEDALLEPIAGVAAQRRVYRAHTRLRRAPGKGNVGAMQRPGTAMVGKLFGEMAMRLLGLGSHHDARRIFVETMDNAWTLDPA